MFRMSSSIFLIGPMGTGKTTVAKVLEAEHGYQRYALATPVQETLDIVAPWTRGLSKAQRRPYAQRVGRFLRRSTPNPMLLQAEQVLSQSSRPLVIDDGRTLEEARWARSCGMTVVTLVASEQERRRRLMERDGALPDPSTFEDDTETEYLRVCWQIVDTTKMSVEEVVEAIMFGDYVRHRGH